MPLAEPAGAVAVALETRGRTARSPSARTPCNRGTGQEARRSSRTPRVWWLRPVSSAARVGEHRAVTWKPVVAGAPFGDPRHVRGRDRARRRSTDCRSPRRRSARAGRSARPQAATASCLSSSPEPTASSVRPIVPPKFGSGIGSTVRSGLNLPIASASDVLQRAGALFVALDDREQQRARKRLLDGEPLLVIEDRDDAGRPGRQVLADLVVDLVLDPMVDELADHPARDRADSDRGEQRRREQADGEPDAAAPARALAAAVVAGLPDGDAAVLARA